MVTLRDYTLSVTDKGLARRVDAFHAACADPRKPYRTQARALYRLLLAPAAKQLAGKRCLLICPDGPLWDLPFQALLTQRGRGRKRGEGFLADRFEISYAYSATGAYAALQTKTERKRTPPTGTLLVVANPDFGDAGRFGDNPEIAGQRPIEAPSRPIGVPSRPIEAPSRPLEAPSRTLFVPRGARLASLEGTQREADALKTYFPDAVVYTGKQAQEATVKQEAGKYRYLHFATHGFFNDAAPLLSSILLAQPEPGSTEDGFLTAREIFDLDLNADLVVLSACNTARGERRNGEGIIGLTWALFVAGAPSQVLSQWSVDDVSTARLMERFYRGLARGEAKGAALRNAMLSLRSADPKSKTRNPKYRHPYYWAPFILVGDRR